MGSVDFKGIIVTTILTFTRRIYIFVLLSYLVCGHSLLFAQNQKLVVDLISFDTSYDESNYTMKLSWETASESDVAGFNLYRSDIFSSRGEKINASIIMAQGSPSTGMSYNFSDEPESSDRYYYQLAEISLSTGVESFFRPSIDNDGEDDYDDFVKVFIDEEGVMGGSYYWFNEGTEDDPGDGHQLSIIVTSSASGTIHVKQVNSAPENAPCENVLPWRWEITSDVGAMASIDFFYQVEDLNGDPEYGDYLGLALWDAFSNSWKWQGGTIYTGDHKVRLDDAYPQGYFVLFNRIFGDITGDGYVDEADLQRFADVWLEEASGEFPDGSDARFFNYNKNENNGKQVIDEGDLQVFSDNWLSGTPK
jgi:hypothetical protein